MKNEPQKKQSHIGDVGCKFAFKKGKKKLPKGKYRNVYSYEMPNGDIIHQAFIPKYKWSVYLETEKQAAIEVDKFLINKGLKPVNVLVACVSKTTI